MFVDADKAAYSHLVHTCCNVSISYGRKCGNRNLNSTVWLVSWCFKPSQPQRITLGQKETFCKETYSWKDLWARIKTREQNRVRKRRVVGRIYGMKYSWKGHEDRNRHKNRIKRVGMLGWCMSEHPHHEKVCPWGSLSKEYTTTPSPIKSNYQQIELSTSLIRMI